MINIIFSFGTNQTVCPCLSFDNQINKVLKKIIILQSSGLKTITILLDPLIQFMIYVITFDSSVSSYFLQINSSSSTVKQLKRKKVLGKFKLWAVLMAENIYLKWVELMAPLENHSFKSTTLNMYINYTTFNNKILL